MALNLDKSNQSAHDGRLTLGIYAHGRIDDLGLQKDTATVA